MADRARIVVVTGLSGSGRSSAIRVLEDLGFYCIDNLPVVLMPKFLELAEGLGEGVRKIAFGIDLRERAFFGELQSVIDQARAQGQRVEVLFLDAADDVLVRRFSETRRPHPAAEGGGIADGIRREREKLKEVREASDRIVDTSGLTVHELRATLRDLLERAETGTMTVTLVSFGYKYGLPTDADLVFDCRFLPNPFFVEELRHRVGTDPAVAAYVLDRDETRQLLESVMALLDFALPRYQHEGKSYLSIAVGCTGGRHRSIALIEELRRRLAERGYRVLVRHRDVER